MASAIVNQAMRGFAFIVFSTVVLCCHVVYSSFSHEVEVMSNEFQCLPK